MLSDLVKVDKRKMNKILIIKKFYISLTLLVFCELLLLLLSIDPRMRELQINRLILKELLLLLGIDPRSIKALIPSEGIYDWSASWVKYWYNCFYCNKNGLIDKYRPIDRCHRGMKECCCKWFSNRESWSIVTKYPCILLEKRNWSGITFDKTTKITSKITSSYHTVLLCQELASCVKN